MKHLTPQLYVDINTAADDRIEALYEQWEAAGANARADFLRIKNDLPPNFVELWQTRCLHDAEVLGINVSGGTSGAGVPVAVVNVRQGDDVLGLVYDLLHEPRRSVPVSSDVFTSDESSVTWLYDEIEVLSDSAFRHEILLSTGEVLALEFFQFGLLVYHGARGPAVAVVSASAT
ncbi:MAG: hypothetical protein ACREJB_11890 [Planctomycetaceae bacterium]